MDEREKYTRMWEMPRYRDNSPAYQYREEIVNTLGAVSNRSVIDFGCGTGRLSRWLADEYGCRPIGVDIADNCLDAKCDIPLIVQPLWDPINVTAEFGVCFDTMEHLPTGRVHDALKQMSQCVRRSTAFQIANFDSTSYPYRLDKTEDKMHLHLTIKGMDWWLDVLRGYYGSAEPWVVQKSAKRHFIVCAA